MSKQQPPTPGSIDIGRRRFARAGVAGSALLGTIASQPVLGAAPYHCTVSGQMSGNMSYRPDQADSCVIGDSESLWADADAALWLPIVKAKSGSVNATIFNGYRAVEAGPVLANQFFFKEGGGAGGGLHTVDGSGRRAATMLEVLQYGRGLGAVGELGAVTVASLLNAQAKAPNYPLSQSRVIVMFNAVRAGGLYQFETYYEPWGMTEVVSYLSSLYPSV